MGARQGAGPPAADARGGGGASHPLHDGAPPRHRRDARRARRHAARDPRLSPPPWARAGGDRAKLPREADDPSGRCPRAGRARSRPHGRRGAPGARPGGERASAAESFAGGSSVAARRGDQRLGRHLPAHARLREPRGAVAARRGAGGDLSGGGVPPGRAPARLSRLRDRPGVVGARAPGARRWECVYSGGPHMSWFDPWDEIEGIALSDRPLPRALGDASPAVRQAVEHVLDGGTLPVEAAEQLLQVTGPDLLALVRAADEIRRADVGDDVTYVVNRNINFTNVCFVNCRFCAFKRQRWEEDAYTHGLDVVLGKVDEAIGRGATEVCMQGGINPDMDAFTYRDILVAIKTRHPTLHVHAFSPMEIMYGARRTGMDYPAYIGMLRDAGLGSIPGTAAEILDDEVREILSHKKVDVRTRIEIITTAHHLGVPTTSTVMYGHVETPGHVARHLDLLRTLQRETGGFTEFVPLGFIWENTHLYHDGQVTPQPKGLRDLRMYAVSRLMFRGVIDHLQTSWVKLGHRLAQLTLRAGCDDFGGTLMEESISREAGADAGEYTSVEEIETLVRAMGRNPVQRTTLYGRIGESRAITDHGAGGGRGSSPVSPGAPAAH